MRESRGRSRYSQKGKIQSNMSEDEKEVDLESSDDVSDLVCKIPLFIYYILIFLNVYVKFDFFPSEFFKDLILNVLVSNSTLVVHMA